MHGLFFFLTFVSNKAIMVILNRKEVLAGLKAKLDNSTDNELVELYEQLYNVTPIIRELVNEEYIEQAIWNDTHVTVTVQDGDEGILIIPDSYQELADYWEVKVDSCDFWDELEKLERHWSEQIGKEITK